MFFPILLGISLFISIGIFLIVYFHERKKNFARSFALRLLLVRLPLQHTQDDKNRARDWKDEINASSQLFGALASLNEPFVFEAAVPNVGEEIGMYVSVPRGKEEFAARQIQGLWKDAQIDIVHDFNVFHAAGVAAGVYLKQKKSYIFPIRTYIEAGIDTVSTILSSLSNIQIAGEGIALQILVKPASPSLKSGIIKARERLQKGEGIDAVAKNLGNNGFFSFIKGTLFPKKKKDEDKLEKVVDVEMVKALDAKVSRPLFVVNVRLIVSAATKLKTDELLSGFMGSFAQFTAPQRNEFKFIKPRRMDDFLMRFSFRQFDKTESMILNSEELASIFHMPTSSTVVPRIKSLKNREAVPPNTLPEDGTFIGRSSFRGIARPVNITDEDRRRHVYIIGQTGTGKTTLISSMAVKDIERGRGVAVIDPHGELIKTITAHVPQSRMKDVIIFDPGDIERPLGLNMLEYDRSRPEEKTLIVNEMQGIFNKLFLAETMGPMFEQYMRNALLLLMDDPDETATLMEVPRVFTDPLFRASKLKKSTNPIVIDFWEKEAVKTGGDAALQNMTPYITSKFNNFIANDYIRPIVGQALSAFNFRSVMDEGRIVLVNLSKGKIGDLNANFLGMILTGKFLMAALSRTDIPEEKRRDFNLYIDEFQNFTTDSISTILSEARKYRLNLVIAHQFIAQLTEKIRDAVFGNVGSMITFRIGVKDAEILTKQFEPVFSANDLMNIDNHNAYVKLLIRGATTLPFNIKTSPLQTSDNNVSDMLYAESRAKYGKYRQDVEESILKRLRISRAIIEK